MNIIKKNIMPLGMIVLLTVMMLLVGTVSAVPDSELSVSFADDQSDVTNSDIDIIHIETEKVGDNVTFTMEVNGDITTSGDYFYHFFVTQTESKSESDADVLIEYVDGSATYTAIYSTGGSTGNADSDVSGSTLTASVNATIFDPLDSFNVFASANDGSSLDWTYSWEDDGEEGSGSNGDSDSTESTQNIIDDLFARGMMCLAVAIIIPIIVLAIIVVVVIKLLSSEDKGGQQPSQQRPPQQQQPQQQQQPPQQEQPPSPPGDQGSSEDTPPPPEND